MTLAQAGVELRNGRWAIVFSLEWEQKRFCKIGLTVNETVSRPLYDIYVLIVRIIQWVQLISSILIFIKNKTMKVKLTLFMTSLNQRLKCYKFR